MSETTTLKIGIIKETKVPHDNRVTLNPKLCREIMNKWKNVKIVVQRSPIRCYKDSEYEALNIEMVDDVPNCKILLGVKEVKPENLINDRLYFIFSHTHKKQAYNRELLQRMIEKRIHLVDYECLTNDKGFRVIAFGRWAGIVGAHNAMYTWGKRTGAYQIDRMGKFLNFEAVKELCYSKGLNLAKMRVLLTGDGRVASGSVETLDAIGLTRVSPEEFLKRDNFDKAVYCQLSACHMYAKPNAKVAWTEEFFRDPSGYISIIGPYLKLADVFINGIYWDSRAAPLYGLNEMRADDYRIRVIADITCDIAPVASIPSTLRPSTIADPIYGFDFVNNKEDKPFQKHCVDVMAIDNLPNELPRDASDGFGNMFVEHVLPELMSNGPMIQRATIAKDGKVGEYFKHLQGFVDGTE